MESLIKKLYSKTTLDELNHDLTCLGKDTKYNATSFCKNRILTSWILFIIIVIFWRNYFF